MLIFIIILILAIIQAALYNKRRNAAHGGKKTLPGASPALVAVVFFLVGTALSIIIPLFLASMNLDLSQFSTESAVVVVLLMQAPAIILSYLATVPFFTSLKQAPETTES